MDRGAVRMIRWFGDWSLNKNRVLSSTVWKWLPHHLKHHILRLDSWLFIWNRLFRRGCDGVADNGLVGYAGKGC